MSTILMERRIPPPPPEWGDHLKRLMGAAGVSPQELAKAVDVSRETVYRWQRGERYPETVYLGKIRDTLRLGTVDELLEPSSRVASDLAALRREVDQIRDLLRGRPQSRQDPREWP